MTDLQWASVTPKKCRRHQWVLTEMPAPDSRVLVWVKVCRFCRREQDPVASRRARNNRKRGNAIQRQRIVALGGRNLAGNNPNLDGLGAMFTYEHKSGGSFPKRAWRWLKGIPHNAGQTPVLIITDTPGPGRRARSVVIVDYDDWRELHGEDDAA